MQKQIAGQLSFFDIKYQDTLLGYIDDNKIVECKGAEIPYGKLGEYIGRKILYSMPRQGAVNYKIIIVTSFSKDSDNVYGSKKRNINTTYEPATDNTYRIIGKASRIGYTDDNRKHKENSWVSELHCSNGRYKEKTLYQSCMYELI